MHGGVWSWFSSSFLIIFWIWGSTLSLHHNFTSFSSAYFTLSNHNSPLTEHSIQLSQSLATLDHCNLLSHIQRLLAKVLIVTEHVPGNYYLGVAHAFFKLGRTSLGVQFDVLISWEDNCAGTCMHRGGLEVCLELIAWEVTRVHDLWVLSTLINTSWHHDSWHVRRWLCWLRLVIIVLGVASSVNVCIFCLIFRIVCLIRRDGWVLIVDVVKRGAIETFVHLLLLHHEVFVHRCWLMIAIRDIGLRTCASICVAIWQHWIALYRAYLWKWALRQELVDDDHVFLFLLLQSFLGFQLLLVIAKLLFQFFGVFTQLLFAHGLYILRPVIKVILKLVEATSSRVVSCGLNVLVTLDWRMMLCRFYDLLPSLKLRIHIADDRFRALASIHAMGLIILIFHFFSSNPLLRCLLWAWLTRIPQSWFLLRFLSRAWNFWRPWLWWLSIWHVMMSMHNLLLHAALEIIRRAHCRVLWITLYRRRNTPHVSLIAKVHGSIPGHMSFFCWHLSL